jgi:DNA-binding beta-propeller fold protein YncE
MQDSIRQVARWLLAAAVLVAATAVPAARQSSAPKPVATYWAYVGAESADLVQRIRFGPDGTVIEKTTLIGELPTEMEGPHGLQISPDGRYLYMTTGHGRPDGKLWKFELGDVDRQIGEGIQLGMFPASLDITPDGLYTLSVNFNLHGDMVPSTVSVVYTPDMEEVARIVTCTMPHGSRIDASGLRQYSTCMMDDQLVEIDTRSFKVARRFSLAKGKEGPLPADADPHAGHAMTGASPKPVGPPVDPAEVGYLGERHEMTPATCSPTWAQPSVDGRKIFVACNKADEIAEIDRDTWTITRRLKTGRGVYNLAVTPDGRLLLATLKQGSLFEIFDLATGKSLAQLKTSNALAHGVAVSSDSLYAFVSSEGRGAEPGKVDVFDLRARTLAGSVNVGQQASGITFWKKDTKEAKGSKVY